MTLPSKLAVLAGAQVCQLLRHGKPCQCAMATARQPALSSLREGALIIPLSASSHFPRLQPFFEALHRAVAPGGIVCTQAESLWLHLDIIKALAAMCKDVFVGGSVSYAYTTIPTYPR